MLHETCQIELRLLRNDMRSSSRHHEGIGFHSKTFYQDSSFLEVTITYSKWRQRLHWLVAHSKYSASRLISLFHLLAGIPFANSFNAKFINIICLTPVRRGRRRLSIYMIAISTIALCLLPRRLNSLLPSEVSCSS